MAIYTIELDGQTLDIEGPDDATEAELEAFARQNTSSSVQATPTQDTPLKSPENASSSVLERAARLVQAAGSPISAIQTVGKAAVSGDITPLTQVPGDILSLAGAAQRGIRGSIVGLQGGGLQRAAEATQEDFQPQNTAENLAEKASNLADFAIPTSLGIKGAQAGLKGGKAVLDTLKRTSQALSNEGVDVAKARTLELLGNKGLKDIKPIIFNKNQREEAINFAETAAKNVQNLTPAQLQEARSTLKDVLDNSIIKASSPSGQIVSRAKDVITKRFREINPDISEAFDATDRAVKAEAIRKALSKVSENLPLVGPTIRQGKRVIQAVKGL